MLQREVTDKVNQCIQGLLFHGIEDMKHHVLPQASVMPPSTGGKASKQPLSPYVLGHRKPQPGKVNEKEIKKIVDDMALIKGVKGHPNVSVPVASWDSD